MKAYISLRGSVDRYVAIVQQGEQYFTLAEGPKSHCAFIVKMFKKALKAHDKALLAKKPRSEWNLIS